MKTLVVVNPYSAHGSTAAKWAEKHDLLKQKIGDFDVALSTAAGDASILTREGLKNGYQRIIGVGGDGTINEIINGFFEDDSLINHDAILSIIMTGTGGDFRKSVGVSKDIDKAIDQLAFGTIRKIDLGKIIYTSLDNQEKTKYFDNIASFGMSGMVNNLVSSSPFIMLLKKISGSFAFAAASLIAILTYSNKTIQLKVDDKTYNDLRVKLVCVANGQFFGGGMNVAPQAKIDDGKFNVIVFENIGKLQFLLNHKRIYKGTHLAINKVKSYEGQIIKASSEDDVFVEADGEVFGKLPATFQIIPAAINFKC